MPPNTTIADELHHEWVKILWRASTEMLVALKRYHKRCVQHLKQEFANNEDMATQLLQQPGAEDILERIRTVSNKNRQKLEEKHHRKLNSLLTLPSRSRLKMKKKTTKEDVTRSEKHHNRDP